MSAGPGARYAPVMLYALALLGCAPAVSDPVPVTRDQCATDLPIGAVARLTDGFPGGTEGITFSEGRMLVSSPGDGVREVTADGVVHEGTAFDHALGLAPAAGGALVAESGAFTLDGSGDDGTLQFTGFEAGAEVTLASGIPNPNFVALAPWGEALVSDDTGDVVYGVDLGTGAVRDWLVGVPSPNGLGFSPDGATLYAVSTFVPEPPLWRVPVSADGVAGTPEAVVHLATGATPDGLAVDAEGAVWVAANLDGEVIRVDPDTGEATAVGSGLTTPASLAFGAGEGFDPCSLYATELYGAGVVRLSVGVEGLPIPTAPR